MVSGITATTNKGFPVSQRATTAVLPNPEVLGLEARVMAVTVLLITVSLVSLSQAVWMLAT